MCYCIIVPNDNTTQLTQNSSQSGAGKNEAWYVGYTSEHKGLLCSMMTRLNWTINFTNIYKCTPNNLKLEFKYETLSNGRNTNQH